MASRKLAWQNQEDEKVITAGDNVVMSFDEIAAALGIGKKAAQMRFYTGMQKLRERPERLRELRELVNARRRFREQRCS